MTFPMIANPLLFLPPPMTAHLSRPSHHRRPGRLRTLLLCLLSGMAVGTTLAHAAAWQAAGGDKKSQVAVNVEGAVRTGDSTRIWYRESYGSRQVIDSGAFSYTVMLGHVDFNCTKRTAQTLQKIYRDSDGRERNNDQTTGPVSAVVPDTHLERVFNLACKKPEAKVEDKPAPPPTPAPVEDPKVKRKVRPGGKDSSPIVHVEPHWSYAGEGSDKATGPAEWSRLKPDWAICSEGKRQSPIDIREAIPADLPPLEPAYQAVQLSIIDNGHTVQVNTPGAGTLVVEGESFDLMQFHFHRPSEEKVNGKAFDMVAHLVHRSSTGKLAVIAVPIQGEKKAESKLLRTLWNNLPLEAGKPLQPEGISIDPAQLLPKNRAYYTYLGSLTTPPCTEGVRWFVFKAPLAASPEQVASFGKLYPHNARPIQPANGRTVKGSR